MPSEDQEIWKVYPEFQFIEVSNLGRVRTKDRYVRVKGRGKRLIKGRFLKQQLGTDGYKHVCFRVKGKQVCLSVHRMVAITFIPNPNNYSQVNHKDNNRINNSVSNLEWCTVQYNNDYKNNFGTSPAEVFGKPVFAINLKTGKVLKFKSQREAARQLGIDVAHINEVVKGRKPTAGGHWFTEDESEITEEKIREIKAKMYFLGGVIVVNLDTFEVLWFKSQSEASRQLGVNHGHINMVIKGKRNKSGGYWFTYADENAVEKTREKFGDEVAKKVEKLLRSKQ